MYIYDDEDNAPMNEENMPARQDIKEVQEWLERERIRRESQEK